MHSLTVVSLSRLATFRYYPRDQYQWLDFVERENVRHCIEVRDGACLYCYYTLCVCVVYVVCVCVSSELCGGTVQVCGVYSAWCVQSRGPPVLCTVVLCVLPSWYARSAMTC